MMEDSLLMDAVERFVKDEMSKEEKIYFEDLRKKNPDLDQAVVEQIFFLNQFTQHNAQRHFLGSLTEVQHKLITEGVITRTEKTEEAKVIQLWKRYKRTIGVAASIAGIVSIFIASLVSAVSTQKATNIKPLVEKLHQQETKTRQMERKINKLEAAVVTPPATILDGEAKFRATGFLVDATNNLIITNAHVVKEALNRLIIENNDGLQFIARAIYIDESKDLAVLEVIDPRFKKLPAVPFAIKRNTSNLGEHVFMLGYPKQEVVYGEGYISAKNGYQMDTIYCQLSTAANEGSSGSPVVNAAGEVVGIVTSTETTAQGVVYAIKSSNIYRAMEEVRKLEGYSAAKLNSNSSIKGLGRVGQIKKLEDYVFMIKGN